MLRGYNWTEVIKNEKGVNEARNKTKTGGNEGMKKERKKVVACMGHDTGNAFWCSAAGSGDE